MNYVRPFISAKKNWIFVFRDSGVITIPSESYLIDFFTFSSREKITESGIIVGYRKYATNSPALKLTYANNVELTLECFCFHLSLT